MAKRASTPADPDEVSNLTNENPPAESKPRQSRATPRPKSPREAADIAATQPKPFDQYDAIPPSEVFMSAPVPPPQPPSGMTSPQGNLYAEAIARDVPPPPSFWQSLGRGFSRVVGWLIALALGLALALALLVFNLPPFNQLPNPLRDNANKITELETELADLEAMIATMSVDQVAMVEAMEATADGRFAEIEAQNAEQEAMIEQAETGLDEASSMLSGVESDLDTFSTALNDLQEELPGAAEYAEYNRQLLLMRAWQEVFTARAHLRENNVGLALNSISMAQGLLIQARELSTSSQAGQLEPVQERLELVVRNIEENPFAATSDLDVAWRALGDLILPPGVNIATPTPLSDDADLTPTPTPAGEDQTGTPSASPTP